MRLLSAASFALLAVVAAACVGHIGDGGPAPSETTAGAPGEPAPQGGGPSPSPGAGTPPPPPSSNVIDVAIWPRLVRDHTTKITRASDTELCRRLSLDLTGAIPSPEEVAACAGKSPEQMARAFMATQAFVAREVRLWVQTLGENPVRMNANLLISADRILARLASGAIGYDDFVAQIVAHPVVTLNRRTDVDVLADVATNVFVTFLGRAPVGDETNDFADLFRVWLRLAAGDPKGVIGYRPNVAGLDPRACKDPVFGAEACTSRALGAATTIQLPDNPPGTGCFNQFNLDDQGGRAGPPDGVLCFDSVGANAPSAVDAQGNLPQALRQELEKPGRLLATRAEFWEQAGERALMRMLGWWKASLNEPETVVPEVRVALGAWFRAQAKHDLRDLYATITSSLLYTRTELVDPSDSARVDGVAPWLSGPTKAMTGEQYLDSAIKGLQRKGAASENGPCDAHVSTYAFDGLAYIYYFPAPLRVASDQKGDDFYRANATLLGACQGGAPSQAQPGLRGLFAQVGIGQGLCDDKAVLAPAGTSLTDGSDTTIDAVTSFQFQRLVQREPEAGELDAARKLAKDCLGDASCGATKGYAGLLCQTLLRSGSFVFY
jgi:hypothetical protein